MPCSAGARSTPLVQVLPKAGARLEAASGRRGQGIKTLGEDVSELIVQAASLGGAGGRRLLCLRGGLSLTRGQADNSRVVFPGA